jgi:hypothetical protein
MSSPFVSLWRTHTPRGPLFRGKVAGQVIVFDPERRGETPAEVLGLYETVERRAIDAFRRETASCAYQPDPSVVMTNQIIGGLMVDAYRRLLAGEEIPNIFYNSRNDARIFGE